MATGINEAARGLVEILPDDSSWDDLVRMIQVRVRIEQGLADVEAGRTVSHEDMLQRFGLSE